jgi:hypothetical protein
VGRVRNVNRERLIPGTESLFRFRGHGILAPFKSQKDISRKDAKEMEECFILCALAALREINLNSAAVSDSVEPLDDPENALPRPAKNIIVHRLQEKERLECPH